MGWLCGPAFGRELRYVPLVADGKCLEAYASEVLSSDCGALNYPNGVNPKACAEENEAIFFCPPDPRPHTPPFLRVRPLIFWLSKCEKGGEVV